MTNPTPAAKAKSTRATTKARADARAAQTAAATAANQRRRHDRMAGELAFLGWTVFPPEATDQIEFDGIRHLAVPAPASLDALGGRADGRMRSTVRRPTRG